MRILPFVLLGILLGVSFAPIEGQQVQTLSVSTKSQSFSLTASHIVQPFGKYTFDPNGSVFAANGLDNITISPQGMGAYSSYQYNSTYWVYSSTVGGCTLSVSYSQQGPSIEQTIKGTNCLGASLDFKVTSSADSASYPDSCTLQFKGESYSWCGGEITGATVSRSGSEMSMSVVTSSFIVDPSVVQSNACAAGSSNTCNVAFGSNVTSGDSLVVVAEEWNIASAETSWPSRFMDTLSTSLTSALTYDAPTVSTTHTDGAILYGVFGSSGADTVTFTASSTPGEIGMQIYEVSGGTLVLGNTGTGNCASVCLVTLTTSSVSFTGSNLLIGGMVTDGGWSPGFQGSGFTAVYSSLPSGVASQYSTSVSSPTTFPATDTSGRGWIDFGVAFTATSTVTITGKCTQEAAGVAQDTDALSGGSISPATIACDGNTHALTATASSTITVTVGTSPSNQQYYFNPSGTLVTSFTFNSGSSSSNEFWHDYLTDTLSVYYSGIVSTAPVFHYTVGGNTTTYTMSTTPTNKIADDTTSWTITKSGNFPSANERYDTLFANSTASALQTVDPAFYHQLRNSYKFVPQTPSAWDGIYTTSISGTYYGTSSFVTSCPSTSNGGGSVTCSNEWYDYNLPVVLQYTVGFNWFAQSPYSFTDTTGANTHSVNYIQVISSGGTQTSIQDVWPITIPIVLLLIFLAAKRK